MNPSDEGKTGLNTVDQRPPRNQPAREVALGGQVCGTYLLEVSP